MLDKFLDFEKNGDCDYDSLNCYNVKGNIPSWIVSENIKIFGNDGILEKFGSYRHVPYYYISYNGGVNRILNSGSISYGSEGFKYGDWDISIDVVTVPKDSISFVNKSSVKYDYDNHVSIDKETQEKPDDVEQGNTENGKCDNSKLDKSIKLILNYGYDNKSDERVITYGSDFTEVPTRENYIFDGWYYDSSFTLKIINKSIQTIGEYDLNDCLIGYMDVELYAKWIKVFKSEDVSIFAINNELDNVDSIEIKAIENDDKIRNFVEKKLNQFKVYDITLLDNNGNNVQPSGNVKVSIRIPEKFDKNNIEVYRVDGEQLINYDVVIDGDNAIIETDHFSNYIIGEKMVTKNPNTGDNGITYIFLCSVLVGFFIVVANRFSKIKQV